MMVTPQIDGYIVEVQIIAALLPCMFEMICNLKAKSLNK